MALGLDEPSKNFSSVRCTLKAAWLLPSNLESNWNHGGVMPYLLMKKLSGRLNLVYFVVFSTICLSRSDECGRIFVYRRDGTRFDKNHFQVTHQSGRKTVPVWAWFSASGAGDFVQIDGRFVKEKYLDILNNILLPSIERRFPNRRVKFIQDNSPIHKAIVVRQWFREHPNIQVLPWPPKGADMNPIENVWGDMVKDLEGSAATTKEELFEKVSSIWERYRGRPNYWRKLAYSMVKRLDLVREAQGYWTKY